MVEKIVNLKEQYMTHPDIGQLVKTILDGDQIKAAAQTRKLLSCGIGKDIIIKDGVENAMSQLDLKCTIDEYDLIEIMLSGRAVTYIIKELYPKKRPRQKGKKTIILAALEGDIHDLGKNILKTVFTSKGHYIVDCGVDCNIEKLINAITKENNPILAISGLITMVIPRVRQIRYMLKKSGLKNIKIMAGGAALRQSTAKSLNIDFIGKTAFDGIHYVDKIQKEENEQH